MNGKARWTLGVIVILAVTALRALFRVDPSSSPPGPTPPPSNPSPRGDTRRQKLFRLIANLAALVLTAFATVVIAVQQADASRVESLTRVQGYLAAGVSGPFVAEIGCDAFVTLNHENAWECTAGLKWDRGKMWREAWSALEMPAALPASLVVFVVDSDATLTLLPDEGLGVHPDPPAIRRVSGSGGLIHSDPVTGDGISTPYSAVGMNVDNVKKCLGFIINDHELWETSGLPMPNSCTLKFRLVMPQTSVAVSDGIFSFTSIEFNNIWYRNGTDCESVWSDLDIDPSAQGMKYLDAFVPSRLYLDLVSAPLGWVPSALNPAPVDSSAGLGRPAWSYDGGGRASFVITATGSVPTDYSNGYRVFLLGALVGVLGSLVASSILSILQAVSRR